MAKLDPFKQQLVDMVRNLPDEAILQLVRRHLGASRSASSKSKAAPRAKAGKRGRRASREALVAEVERFIAASDGVAISDVAKALGAPKPRIASAIRTLKDAGRIHQGGERRFARYAATAKQAKEASKRARGK